MYEFENTGDRRIGVGAVRCSANRDSDGERVSARDRVTTADIPLGMQRGIVLLKVGETAEPAVECRVEVTHWMSGAEYVEAVAVSAGPPDLNDAPNASEAEGEKDIPAAPPLRSALEPAASLASESGVAPPATTGEK
jgi:hypothetical protein